MKIIILRFNPLDVFDYQEWVDFLTLGEEQYLLNNISDDEYIGNLKMFLSELEKREQYEWCSIVVEKINNFNNENTNK